MQVECTFAWEDTFMRSPLAVVIAALLPMIPVLMIKVPVKATRFKLLGILI
jgi:hypothetical protein